MKQLMKIIGAELVHQTTPEDGIVELTLTPYETVTKKKVSLMDIATGGIDSVMNEAIGSQKRKTKMYINLMDWISEFKNQPLSNVWLEITLDETAEEIVKGGK